MSSGPSTTSTRVPVVPSARPSQTALVVPSSCGSSRSDRPFVRTRSWPPDARTAPATTRRPLPSAPRVGNRTSFVEVSGRLNENSDAIVLSAPAIPGPSSST